MDGDSLFEKKGLPTREYVLQEVCLINVTLRLWSTHPHKNPALEMSSNRVDIAALLARLSLPADNPPKDSKFTLCSDPDSVKEAVDALSSCSTIILDCEALSLGNQGGTLSLISLRTTPVSSARTFIIDAVALSSEELQPILDLIQSNAIQKVVFDGRMDNCAFYFEYNTRIQNVIDLQLADIQSRTLRGEATISQRNRLVGYLLRSEVNGWRKGRYEQIHALAGIARCLRDHDLQVQDKSVCEYISLHLLDSRVDVLVVKWTILDGLSDLFHLYIFPTQLMMSISSVSSTIISSRRIILVNHLQLKVLATSASGRIANRVREMFTEEIHCYPSRSCPLIPAQVSARESVVDANEV